MKTIQEYTLVSAASVSSLSVSVNALLRQGWTLHGSPMSIGNVVTQAVVREVELQTR